MNAWYKAEQERKAEEERKRLAEALKNSKDTEFNGSTRRYADHWQCNLDGFRELVYEYTNLTLMLFFVIKQEIDKLLDDNVRNMF